MKTVNIILGLGTAIIVGALLSLGIRAFYPEPMSPTYPETVPAVENCVPTDTACAAKVTAAQQAASDQYQNQEQIYEDQSQIYNRNFFVIANILGMLIFIIGFCLLFATAIAAQSVPIGLMIAGLWGIMYGYMRGWGSVDDRLKFFIGLLIALIVIGGSVWLVQRYAEKRKLS